MSAEPTDAAPLLEVADLRTRYGRIQALHGVSLSVRRGSLVALVGANGAGKTTLLRTISGVHRATSGTIVFDGKDITRASSDLRVRSGISQVPEGRQVFGPMSVEDNLLLPAIALKLPADERKRRLAEIYALLPEVAALYKRPAGVLSGGQGKMVALGRALVAGTRYVLLDEPFQGLAPALALSYADALVRLRRSRPELGLLITESTPKLLDKIVDSALTIERGEVS